MSDGGGGQGAASQATPSLPELFKMADTLLAIIAARLGSRTAAILMIGTPIDATGHDRFCTRSIGPCLMTRGLLHWGVPTLEAHFDAVIKSYGEGPAR